MKKNEWQIAGIVLVMILALITVSNVKAMQTKPASKTYANNNKVINPAPTPARVVMSKPEPKAAPAPGKETTMNRSTDIGTEPSTDNQYRSLKEILTDQGNPEGDGMTIVVQKRDHVLTLYLGSQKLKSYHVELGDSGLGDKVASGDHKTPEGIFYITEKSAMNPPDQFLGTRWMRLSYPNIEDAKRGLEQGIINQETCDAIVSAIRNGETPPQDTALGGGVGIHGGTTAELGSNWTWGCVGLTNQDVNEFYDFIKVGTPVVIRY